MKKILILLVILAVLGGGGYYVYSRVNQGLAAMQMADPTSEAVTVQRGELIATIKATGQVRPRQTAVLSWQTSGAVLEVIGKVGGKVNSGDLLAVLDPASLSQSLISAEAELLNAQQSLADLETQADNARVQAMQSIVNFEQAFRDAQYRLDNFSIPANQRQMTAVEAVAAMKKALDEARLAFEPYRNASSGDPTRQRLKEALDLAQADYNAAVRRLAIEYDVEVAQANLKKAYQDYEKWKNGPDPNDVRALEVRIAGIEASLAASAVRAPFSGTVTLADALPGDQVTPGATAFRIDDLSVLYIDLQVTEIDISQVHPGQSVNVTLDALRDRRYHGLVESIALVGSQGSGVVNYTVTVTLEDADEDVLIGMTGEVEIVVAQKDDVVLVPNQVIKLEDGQQVVYVVVAGEAPRRVEVSLGLANEQFSELVKGELQPGDLLMLRAVEDSTMRFMMGGGPRNGQEQP